MTDSIAQRDQHLNELILSGKALEGFDAYYADDVEMQENAEAPRKGKDLNREFEIKFFSGIEVFHGAKVLAQAVNGDVSFSEWVMDVTFKGGGRVQMQQVAVRRWKDGKIASERFYYNKG
jgi:ketosteroid isomerase-like protein